MRDYGSIYSSARAHSIIYLRQYTDPELEGCNELGDGAEATLVKETYKSADWSEMLEEGHRILFT